LADPIGIELAEEMIQRLLRHAEVLGQRRGAHAVYRWILEQAEISLVDIA